ncbi:hypothetical protein ATO12_02455 [Aquimarina atlantica]|uniref:ATPase AAA-type core domain-containing protein n=1 Tax=Aquimarina atlantica TaxID=1317122 RepID=A0A023C090_9FLAO|nr:ATP-binding protein [Aquimarina atlantica]EZH75670.1 hypothetical protein ATO12_02455 [Aquimarina atlantica]
MILRYNISNFLSFNDTTEFNLFIGDYRRFDNHVYKFKDLDILKLTSIYGANATGKSNLVKAFDYLRDAVLEDDLTKLKVPSFKGNEDKPTELEIEFITKNTAYIYGFELLRDNIIKEYLYYSGISKKDTLIFDREVDKNGVSKIEVNKKLLKTKKFQILKDHYEERVNSNQLFLNLIGDIDLGDLSNEIEAVIKWMIKMQVIFPTSKPQYLVSNLLNEPSFMDFTRDMLCSFDTGIKNLHIKEFNISEYFGEDDKDLVNDLIEDLEKNDGEDIPLSVDMIVTLKEGEPVVKRLYVEHIGFGTNNLFSFNEESDGTKRLIEFMSMLYNLIVKEGDFSVYIIDEIGRSIHPSLLKEFLSKLSREDQIKGQLIFTTHESNLLDLNMLRPDEIWFAEKNRERGNTEFKTLAEFKKIRPDLNIRKGYLNGRFGGIPILANFDDLNWTEYASN